MSEPFLGQITVFPYSFPPRTWADCAGQLLPISQNTALFSLLGTTFGGNGQTSFALPDLQGRVPVGQGTPAYPMGIADGAEGVTVQTASMPTHSHSLNAATEHGTVNTPEGQLLATPQVGLISGDKGEIYNAASPNTALSANAIIPAGGNQPHNNLQPFLVLRYCIAMQGMFPPRS